MAACVKCGHNPDAAVIARWEFVVDREVESMNAHRMNAGGRGRSARAAQRRYRDSIAAWEQWFQVARRNNGIGIAILPSTSSDVAAGVGIGTANRRVTLTRIMAGRERPFDRDNLAGGCKVVVDAMVRAGLLADDTADVAEIHYAQERASNGKAGLRVLLEELAA